MNNHVSATAWMTAHKRTFTDIPYSKEIFLELEKLRKNDIPEEYKTPELTPQIEARYKLINRLLKESGIKQVLEIASGLSSRGLEMTEDPEFTYVELDLPVILKQKQVIVKSIAEERPKLHFTIGSALDFESLKSALKYFDKKKPIAIINEGLLRYLTMEQKVFVARYVHDLLQEFDFNGVWITPDITLKSVLNIENETTNNRIEKVNQSTGVDIEGNSFNSIDEAEEFFGQLAFKVERHPFMEVKSELVSPKKLNIADEEVDKQLEGPCVFVMRA